MNTETRTITREEYAQIVLPAVDETREGQRLSRWTWYYTRKAVQRFAIAYKVYNPSDLEELVEETIEGMLLEPKYLQELASAMPNHRVMAGMLSIRARSRCANRARDLFARQYYKTHTIDELLQNEEGLLSEEDITELASTEPGFDTVDCVDTLPTLLASLTDKERQVISLLIAGQSVAEIQDKLNIPQRTAYRLIANLESKVRQVLHGVTDDSSVNSGTYAIGEVYDELASII